MISAVGGLMLAAFPVFTFSSLLAVPAVLRRDDSRRAARLESAPVSPRPPKPLKG